MSVNIIHIFAAMLRFASILLIICLLSTSFSRWMIVAGYELNRNYIAAELCVNKAKPALHCNGKCYLAKKIKDEERQQKQQRASSKPIFAEAFLNSPGKFKCFINVLGEIKSLYGLEYAYTSHRSIYHPPPVAC